MAKVLIATEKPFAKVAVDDIRTIMENANFQVAVLEKYTSRQVLLDAVADADALIVRSDVIDETVFDAAKQLKIVGSRLQYRQFAPVIARYALYKDSIDRIVTDTYAFEDSDEAFQYNLARHPETGKVVILFDGKE